METRNAVRRKLTQEPEVERRSVSAGKSPTLARGLLADDYSVAGDSTICEAAAAEGISLDRLNSVNRQRHLRIVWYIDDASSKDRPLFAAPRAKPIEGSNDLVGWER